MNIINELMSLLKLKPKEENLVRGSREANFSDLDFDDINFADSLKTNDELTDQELIQFENVISNFDLSAVTEDDISFETPTVHEEPNRFDYLELEESMKQRPNFKKESNFNRVEEIFYGSTENPEITKEDIADFFPKSEVTSGTKAGSSIRPKLRR